MRFPKQFSSSAKTSTHFPSFFTKELREIPTIRTLPPLHQHAYKPKHLQPTCQQRGIPRISWRVLSPAGRGHSPTSTDSCLHRMTATPKTAAHARRVFAALRCTVRRRHHTVFIVAHLATTSTQPISTNIDVGWPKISERLAKIRGATYSRTTISFLSHLKTISPSKKPMNQNKWRRYYDYFPKRTILAPLRVFECSTEFPEIPAICLTVPSPEKQTTANFENRRA